MAFYKCFLREQIVDHYKEIYVKINPQIVIFISTKPGGLLTTLREVQDVTVDSPRLMTGWVKVLQNLIDFYLLRSAPC